MWRQIILALCLFGGLTACGPDMVFNHSMPKGHLDLATFEIKYQGRYRGVTPDSIEVTIGEDFIITSYPDTIKASELAANKTLYRKENKVFDQKTNFPLGWKIGQQEGEELFRVSLPDTFFRISPVHQLKKDKQKYFLNRQVEGDRKAWEVWMIELKDNGGLEVAWIDREKDLPLLRKYGSVREEYEKYEDETGATKQRVKRYHLSLSDKNFQKFIANRGFSGRLVLEKYK